MEYISIAGGRPLAGEVAASGAKNSVLPLLAAAILFREECTIHGCPDLSDVSAALDILRSLGCGVRRDGETVTIDSRALSGNEISREMMSAMRSSILFLGPVLARTGRCELYAPGGCCLGERPIDLHISGLRALGIEASWNDERLSCRGRPKGNTYVLPFPSVGATENLILAAVGADGVTTICNAAREPEIGDLISFLVQGGAEIYGKDTAFIQIHGKLPVRAEYRVMPDRMEAATFFAATAATGGCAEVKGIKGEILAPILNRYQKSGCVIRRTDSGIYLEAPRQMKGGGVIRTEPYPGFPTDAQAPVMASYLKADGVTVFEETVFSDRYRHVPALRALGGDIETVSSVAVVTGVGELRGARMEATDLRGGAAMVVAALSAEEESRVYGIHHLRRGYARFCQKLRLLGAEIVEKEDKPAENCQEGIHNG